MSTYILVNGRESFVHVDLLAICPDNSLGFAETHVLGTPFIEVSYNPALQPPSGSPCGLIDSVINRYPGGGDVVIAGGLASDVIAGTPLRTRGGAHVFVPGAAPNTVDSAIVYDVTLCAGNGYVTFDAAGKCIPIPRAVLLFHELAHTQFPLSADDATIEGLVIQVENVLRAANGLPLRASHEGACFADANAAGRCGANPNTGMPNQGGPTTTEKGISCVVTTAATGGPESPQVAFLRSMRDNVLKRTRWGRDFLARVQDYYYFFGPAIAGELDRDKEFRSAFEWAAVTPLVNYYRLAWNRPSVPLDSCTPELRAYLKSIYADMDRWLARIEPPRTYRDISLNEAAVELAVTLRFLFSDPARRREYINMLVAAGEFPLRGNRLELGAANVILYDAGIPLDDRCSILGEVAGRAGV